MSRQDDEFSVIGDKGEVGFIDIDNDPSIYTYDPNEEGPVAISVPFPMMKGKPQSVFVGETSHASITIHNRSSNEVQLWGIKIFASNPSDSFTLSVMEPPSADSDEQYIEEFREYDSLEDRVLQPDQVLTMWLSCKPKEVGMHTSIVHFDLEAERIERVVFLLADDKVSISLAPQRPYSRVPRKRQFIIDESAVSSRLRRRKKPPGTKPDSVFILPEYPIPDTLRELISNNQVPEVLHEGLTTNNYSSYFKALLVMEELHMEKEMKRHNMECVTMRKKRDFLSVEVPGLAEKRPSVVQGDLVFAELKSTRAAASHQGYIYRIMADEVLLRFSYQFHDCHCDANLYNIQFTGNRVNIRRLYQAVEAADDNLGTDFIFPMNSTKRRRLIETLKFVPFSPNLNEEQKRSIEMILGCKGAPPYVIYGPPGTGKTMTMVEAVLQIYKTSSDCRVLVCAASNSAADHILQRLISNEVAKVKDKELFRLNAASRPLEDIQVEHIRFCFFDDSSFRCPPPKALMRYRIIICTYMSSSMLRKEGITRGHFSHIFLDEAGQASEPECMVPVANLCEKDTVVVLAGDPKQLGPVIYSKNAETLGLGKSYLERLFECQFYENEDENYVTKLVRNYRCHPAILDLPSKLFYKGELLACKEDGVSSISSFEYFLPNSNFPILFMGIQGCDEREGNNPSWFNRIEASKVVDTINRLHSSFDLSEADIGVITPYRQQVIKIKQALETYDLLDVKVGSVEQFQGQEREVILVSTVRSTFKHNEFDRIHCLGFLSNPRRFNVAITRARSLLVVIGNPHIVCKDEYWDKLLRYCSENCSYQGCPLPETQEDSDEESVID